MLKVSMKVFLSSSVLFLAITSCFTVTKHQSNFSNDLIGIITQQQIQQSEHANWYNKEVGSYLVDVETLADFENNPERIEALSVKIFLGTWCSDSRREVPRFYSIMSFLNVTNIETIGLDKNKKSPENLEKGMNIHHVPTFILYQNGIEVNRIIETPVESLEKDLIAIIQAKKYSSNYSK
jgi:thiol-disulfide isomerase/thioredoxin